MVLKIVSAYNRSDEVPHVTKYVSGRRVEYFDKLDTPAHFIVSNRNDTVVLTRGVPPVQNAIELAEHYADDETIYVEPGDVAYLMEDGKTVDTIRVK
jgi:hypothetical protein